MIRTSLPELAVHLKSYRIPKYSTIIIHSSLFHFGQFEGGGSQTSIERSKRCSMTPTRW